MISKILKLDFLYLFDLYSHWYIYIYMISCDIVNLPQAI